MDSTIFLLCLCVVVAANLLALWCFRLEMDDSHRALQNLWVRQYCDHHARQRAEADAEYKIQQLWVAHNLLLQAHNDWAEFHRSRLGIDDGRLPGEEWKPEGWQPDPEEEA